jgi:hypothetical protein
MAISVQFLDLTALKLATNLERNLEVITELHTYAYTDFHASSREQDYSVYPLARVLPE